MPRLKYDKAARAAAAFANDGTGAIMFKGWLGPAIPPDDVRARDAQRLRFFIDPHFLDWHLLIRAFRLTQMTLPPSGSSAAAGV